jgi:hypothetical protein
MITDKEWNETKELLQGLFGNTDAALKFHDDIIPLDEKVTNGTIHMALMMQQNICRHCRNKKIFSECRHYVRRTVDNCEGAFSEVKKEELDEQPNLMNACKIKLQAQVGLIMDDRR